MTGPIIVPALFSLALARAQSSVDPSAEWIRAHAIPFSTSEAGHGFDDLAGLERVVGDARIVALGEPTHGTREAFQMKHRLLEYLVERLGFSIFSIEANMPEAFALDAYVNGGEGDPRQLIAGMYFWTWNTEEVLAMVEWMRAWNAAHPERPRLRFTGFDMQTPTVAARIVTEFLEAHAEPELAGNVELIGRVLQLQAARMSFTTATGTFPVEAARGKELVLSVWIRTEIAHGWAGAWWRCDRPDGVGAFDNMGSQGITGTRDWRRYEIRLLVDEDVRSINFGCLLEGEGTAWFDDIEITLDGEPFADPAFGLGFEEGTPSFLGLYSGPGFESRLVDTAPHGGKRCLEIRREKPTEKTMPDVDADDADGVLADMLTHREELVRKTSAREADWAIQNARVVAQWAHLTVGKPGGANLRDASMAENVAWILEQNPGARIVLWAHNGHVSRGKLWGQKWMGAYLEEQFPGEMVVFGFAVGSGTYTAVDAGGRGLKSDHPLHAPPEDSIEIHLAAAGLPRLLLDIRAATPSDPATGWAASFRPMRSIGARSMEQQFFPLVARACFDVLVWQAETTASVLLPR